MDREWGSKPGGGGASSAQNEAIDRRERLRRLALETIDLAKDPYFMRNHLGRYPPKTLAPCARTRDALDFASIYALISLGFVPSQLRVQAVPDAAQQRGELPGAHSGEAAPDQPRQACRPGGQGCARAAPAQQAEARSSQVWCVKDKYATLPWFFHQLPLELYSK
jgi:hypothetical protein